MSWNPTRASRIKKIKINHEKTKERKHERRTRWISCFHSYLINIFFIKCEIAKSKNLKTMIQLSELPWFNDFSLVTSTLNPERWTTQPIKYYFAMFHKKNKGILSKKNYALHYTVRPISIPGSHFTIILQLISRPSPRGLALTCGCSLYPDEADEINSEHCQGQIE